MSVLKQFKKLLPKKPYWSNDPKRGIRIGRNLSATYIQPNSPFAAHWIVIDVDTPLAGSGLFGPGDHIPAPNMSVENPETGHAHYFYRLETPVFLRGKSSKKARAYLVAATRILQATIPGADPHYRGPLSRNPLSPRHRVSTPRSEPYSLGEITEWGTRVPVAAPREKIRKNTGEKISPGERNCFIFRELSKVGRNNVSRFSDRDEFKNFLSSRALGLCKTRLTVPLPESEIRGIVKSVSGWVWNHRENFRKNLALSILGTKGGIASGKARREKREPQRLLARKLHGEGLGVREVARELGVSPSTISRWLSVGDDAQIFEDCQKVDLHASGVARSCIQDNSPVFLRAGGFGNKPTPIIGIGIDEDLIQGQGSVVNRDNCDSQSTKETFLSQKTVYSYSFNSRLKESQEETNAFSLDSLRKIFPETVCVVDTQNNMTYQTAGIDLLLFSKDVSSLSLEEIVESRIRPARTVDKKERFTNPKTGKVYDDIALEMLKVAQISKNTNLSQWGLHKIIETLEKPFCEFLKQTRSIPDTFLLLNDHVQKNELPVTVSPGWATYDRSVRTVDGTLYAIAPKGIAHFIDEEKLQKLFQSKDFSDLLSRGTFMRATISKEGQNSWGVKNFAVDLKILGSYMDISSYEFAPYDKAPKDKGKDVPTKNDELENLL